VRIAFKMSEGGRAIATIHPDGTDTRIVLGHRSEEVMGIAHPIWSPDGGHLVYQRISCPKAVELPADVDLILASADGDFAANLTGGEPGSLIPVAWR
jgi:hypothetical protein